MPAQSQLAKNGFRTGILGSAVDLAMAAALADGNYDVGAHTDAARMGWYFDRTPLAENIGHVVMGIAAFNIFASGIAIPGRVAIGASVVPTDTAFLLPASVVGVSSLRISPGVAPTSPVGGDVWLTTTTVVARLNGVSVTIGSLNQSVRTITLRGQVANGIIQAEQQKIFIPMSIAGTITGWKLTADVATNATVDIWKLNGANPTVADSIVNVGGGGVKPALVGATYASGNVTNWSPVAVVAGDVFELNVDANTAATVLNLVLEMSAS